MRRALLLQAFSILFLSGAALSADESRTASPLAELEESKRRLTTDVYELRYKFHPGEVVRSKVTHLATTETTITGNTQESKSCSISTKLWKITKVDDDGRFTFEHMVEDVEMWQKIGTRDKVSYNSKIDEVAPLEYEDAKNTVGVTLATITVDAHGTVIDRSDKQPTLTLGLGQITIPLPAGKVKIGHQWSAPSEIRVHAGQGMIKRIKTRQLFTLESVMTGVARISVKTQVLTPITDPKIESQLVQQLTNGDIKFDIDAGRILWRQVDWDETVVGFNGPESSLKYLARYTEEYIKPEQVARTPEKEKKN